MSTVTSNDGTTIAFYRTGEGPPVIAVDGAISHPAINPTSAELAALLAPYFTVYTYDRRGRGGSGDTPPYAIAREVEDLEALIAQAGGAACVVAFSSGAMLALDAAARGADISRLALYEAPLIVDDSRPPLPADYLPQMRDFAASGRRADALRLFFTAAIGMPAETAEQMRGGPFWTELEKVAPTLAYDAALTDGTMAGEPLASDRWGAVMVPALVMDGGASPAFMHKGADALARLLPHAERATLEGQTHDVAAETLAPLLTEFFRRQRAAAA